MSASSSASVPSPGPGYPFRAGRTGQPVPARRRRRPAGGRAGGGPRAPGRSTSGRSSTPWICSDAGTVRSWPWSSTPCAPVDPPVRSRPWSWSPKRRRPIGQGPNETPRAARSTHGIGLAGVFRLARAVGAAPRRVVVVGIEGEDFAQGVGLSPAVEIALPDAVDKVLGLGGRALMCVSRLHRVVSTPEPDWIEADDVDGVRHRVSLLAYDGPEPGPRVLGGSPQRVRPGSRRRGRGRGDPGRTPLGPRPDPLDMTRST